MTKLSRKGLEALEREVDEAEVDVSNVEVEIEDEKFLGLYPEEQDGYKEEEASE